MQTHRKAISQYEKYLIKYYKPNQLQSYKLANSDEQIFYANKNFSNRSKVENVIMNNAIYNTF